MPQNMPWRFEVVYDMVGSKPVGLVVDNKGRRAHYNHSDKNLSLLYSLLWNYAYTWGHWEAHGQTTWWFEFRA